MKRAIKFPLIMNDDVEVRIVEDLKIYFNLERVTEYFLNGKLKTWLEQRNYIDQIALIEELEKCEYKKQIPNKLCEIFGVEYKGNIDILEMQNKTERENLLKQFTDDEKWIEKINCIVFNQEELDKLVESNNKKIYIAGDEFTIFNKVKDKEYIGINNPILNLDFKEEYKNNEKSIIIKNARLLSKSKIDIYADISENCDLQGSNIQTNRKFIENVRCIDIDNIDSSIRYSEDIFLIDNNIVYGCLDKLKVINIDTRKVIEERNDIRLLCAYRHNNELILCGSKQYKNVDGMIILDTLTLKEKRSYFKEYDWVNNYGNHLTGTYMYVSNNVVNTYAKAGSGIVWRKVDINSGDGLGCKVLEDGWAWKYLEDMNFDFDNEVLYFADYKNNSLFIRSFDTEIELKKPISDENEYFFDIDCIVDFIVNKGKVITTWKSRMRETEFYHEEFGYSKNGGNDEFYEGFIQVYDLKTGHEIQAFRGHNTRIISIKKARDILITLDIEMTLKLWNIDNFERIGEIKLCEEMRGFITYGADLTKIIFVNYDEISDKILVKFLDKIFILG